MAGEEAAMDVEIENDQASTGHKTVLVVFKNRRRPIRFQGSSDPRIEKKNLLDAVQTTFSDIISAGEGTSGVGGYFLQTQSTEWGGFVDVTGRVEDHSTLLLQSCSSDSEKAQVFR